MAGLKAVKERQGKRGLKELIRAAEDNGYYGPVDPTDIVAKEKYPMEYYLVLLKSYKDMFGDDSLEHLAKTCTEMKGIVGVFLNWFGKPRTVAKNADEHWKQFHDFGRMKGRVSRDHQIVLIGKGTYVDPLYCDMISYYISGVMDKLSDVNDHGITHTKCRSRGDEVCEWTVEWEPYDN